MKRVKDQDLLYVSKSFKERLDSLSAGARLSLQTGYSVLQLQHKAVRDRLLFARELLRHARLSCDARPTAYRMAVSRAYYSMYHIFRAVAFHFHGGDDHEQHIKLPSNIPGDFPNQSYWENELKQARFERNRADYDPYPKKDEHFENAALTLVQTTTTLLPIAKSYLRRKGCAV